jgi:hypothetical protein
MTLTLLGASRAMELCAGDLKGPVNDPPFNSLASELEIRKYLYEVAAWADKSPTAKAILAAVQYSPVEIYVVGMKGGGYSCFNSDYPEHGVGTVYYNLTIKMEVSFPGPGPTETATGFAIGPKKNVELHNYIGFLHELGHAKQYIENPGFFRSIKELEPGKFPEKATWVNREGSKGPVALGGVSAAFQSDPKFKSAIEMKAKEMFAKKYPNVDAYKSPNRQNPLALNRRREGHADVLEGLQYREVRMAKPKWDVRIETDNLNRHEWPMCDELGYPKRNYTDLQVTGH